MNNAKEEPLPKKAPEISIEQDTKIYTVPEEIANIRTRSFALQQLRDIYINMPIGGFKKVIKLHTESARLEIQFWYEIFKLYPELHREKTKGKNVRFHPHERELEIIG